MRIILGGVRGTSTVTDPAFKEFGGDTISFLVIGEKGDELIVDFGSGLRELQRFLYDCSTHRMALITHYHLDHLNGFPTFPLIYDPTASLHTLGPSSGGMDIEDVFSDMLAKPFWPIQMDMLQAKLSFETLGDNDSTHERSFGDFDIRSCPVHHPGGCMAYRIDERSTGDSVVIATDIEWQESTQQEKTAFLDLCSQPKPAKLLFFDGHFTPQNYAQFRYWGHSTWRDGLEIMEQTGLQKTVMIHHSPRNDDDVLKKIEEEMEQASCSLAMGRQCDIYEEGIKINP